MNLEEYILTCKNFAHDTERWGWLTDRKFYTTNGVGCWDESGDNAHGGLDIAWAFHCTDAEIERNAKWRYEAQLKQELDDNLDDRDFDLQQWHATFQRFSINAPDNLQGCCDLASEILARFRAAEKRSYKTFDSVRIGSSDIASLVFRACNGGVAEIHFGGDGSYYAYECIGNVEIGEHYKKVFEGEGWLMIYDDQQLTYHRYGNRFEVYRAGGFGCIIYWPDGCSK